MSAVIYVEGAGDSAQKTELRKAVTSLLRKMGFKGCLPKIVASGSRGNAFGDFKVALEEAKSGEFIAMLIDSEDPVTNIEKTWTHLKNREGDNWEKPEGATDEQVFFMTTCMETWILADREALRSHYKNLKETGIPKPAKELEKIDRKRALSVLENATAKNSESYKKGAPSFRVFAKLNPDNLRVLPSFARMERILKEKLSPPVSNPSTPKK